MAGTGSGPHAELVAPATWNGGYPLGLKAARSVPGALADAVEAVVGSVPGAEGPGCTRCRRWVCTPAARGR